MTRLSRDGVARFLAEESLFRGLPAGAIDRLSEAALQKVVPASATFFSMGQPCDALHFVAEGCASLVRTAPDGRQRILHRATPGEMVGAVPFFDGRDYPASFIADTECIVISFPREKLLALMGSDPALSMSILGGLVERLRLMTALVEQMSFEDAEHRLWDYLVKASSGASSDASSDASNDGCGGSFPRVLDPLPTREHIASTIGTVREVVSRRLSRLADSGHIRIEGRKLVLLKPLE